MDACGGIDFESIKKMAGATTMERRKKKEEAEAGVLWRKRWGGCVWARAFAESDFESCVEAIRCIVYRVKKNKSPPPPTALWSSD
jgi:hypothetical protein